jgi:peptide chain release factor subunit 1
MATTTISWDVLRELAAIRTTRGRAISLYLDLSARVVPGIGDVRTRVHALLDEGSKSERNGGAAVGHERREALRTDVEELQSFFEREFDRDGASGVAVFASGLDSVWRVLPLSEPVPDAVRVGGELHIAPLVSLVGRSDGALVAHVGREQGRLFRLAAGRLTEVVDRSDEVPGRHDQGGWSQSRFRRHIENLARGHLRAVARELDRSFRALGRPQLVLVCGDETRAELAGLLSAEVAAAVVGWAQVEAHASVGELEAAVLPLLEASRAGRESETIERWRDEVGRGGRAVAGWEATLEAASDGRVELLLFEDGAGHEAFRCLSCGRVSVAGGSCGLDGAALERYDDGLDFAVRRTLVHGGTALAVDRGALGEAGVGALLRF